MTVVASEQWRAISDYPLYEVSDQGRVRSSAGRRDPTPRVLKTHVNPQRGYLCVHLRNAERVVTMRVHRLVTEAFLGLRPKGLVTRHLNGDKADNRLVNLEYGTPAENAADSKRLGERPHWFKTHCKRGHEFTATNTYVLPRTGARHCRECRRGYPNYRALKRAAA